MTKEIKGKINVKFISLILHGPVIISLPINCIQKEYFAKHVHILTVYLGFFLINVILAGIKTKGRQENMQKK